MSIFFSDVLTKVASVFDLGEVFFCQDGDVRFRMSFQDRISWGS